MVNYVFVVFFINFPIIRTIVTFHQYSKDGKLMKKVSYRTLSFILFTFFSSNLIASSFHTDDLLYYPADLNEKIQNLENVKITDQQILRDEIFQVLNGIHLFNNNEHDTIVSSCPVSQKCYEQKRDLTYKEAREIMFGKLFLTKTSQGYEVKDMYCEKTITEKNGVGPNRIPDPNLLNCEHTWPQSKFNPKMNTEMQKVDLHHLFPVDSKSNSVRSNHLFGELQNAKNAHSTCQLSQIGTIKGSNLTGFTPPKTHRGNVARAIFYFAVRYQMPIPNEQESFLKKWHIEDPVDQDERDRNNEIYQLQGNRNPFIDFPVLGTHFEDL